MEWMSIWPIGNDTLTFNETTHTYWVNDQKCISVTQLLKYKFPNKYDGIDEAVLKKAAERGTALHEAIEVYELYGIESNEIKEFRNYLFLKKQFGFKVLKNEIPIIIKYKDLIVCGRLDMVLSDNGKTGLGDIKCTSVLDKEYLAYQLNLYKLGYEQCYSENIEFLKGIHLKNDNRKYIDLPINETAAIELLENYRKETKNEQRS